VIRIVTADLSCAVSSVRCASSAAASVSNSVLRYRRVRGTNYRRNGRTVYGRRQQNMVDEMLLSPTSAAA
jgi:hypothetical protein